MSIPSKVASSIQGPWHDLAVNPAWTYSELSLACVPFLNVKPNELCFNEIPFGPSSGMPVFQVWGLFPGAKIIATLPTSDGFVTRFSME